LVANREPIELDSTNNVFVGPNNYFKIVIDSFDGKSIKAWHFEDPKGNKSKNLAAASKGRHIDLLVTKNNNRTIAQFVNRMANRFYVENEAAQARLATLEAELEKVRSKAPQEQK
jgi:hypothetical protein